MVYEKGELMVCGWVNPITIERSATSSHMILTIDPESVRPQQVPRIIAKCIR